LASQAFKKYASESRNGFFVVNRNPIPAEKSFHKGVVARHAHEGAHKRVWIPTPKDTLALSPGQVIPQKPFQGQDLPLAEHARQLVAFQGGVEHEMEELAILAVVVKNLLSQCGEQPLIVAPLGETVQFADPDAGVSLAGLEIEDRGIKFFLRGEVAEDEGFIDARSRGDFLRRCPAEPFLGKEANRGQKDLPSPGLGGYALGPFSGC
jgi:hypothetical protein